MSRIATDLQADQPSIHRDQRELAHKLNDHCSTLNCVPELSWQKDPFVTA